MPFNLIQSRSLPKYRLFGYGIYLVKFLGKKTLYFANTMNDVLKKKLSYMLHAKFQILNVLPLVSDDFAFGCERVMTVYGNYDVFAFIS